MADYNIIIGEELRKERMIARLTAYELAMKLNVSRSTVTYWETGKRSISAEQLMNALDVMNVNQQQFFDRIHERV